MILVNLHPFEWRLASGNLPALFNVTRRDRGENQDARPDDPCPFVSTSGESRARDLNDAAPPAFTFAVWEVAHQQ